MIIRREGCNQTSEMREAKENNEQERCQGQIYDEKQPNNPTASASMVIT
jgi:hypothetical protein